MYLRHCLLVVVASSMLASCGIIPGMDDVVTDRRKEYRKSESLPELEIPPDLTLEADVDPLLIPDEEITTYSEYQRQRDLRSGGATGGSEVIDLGNEQVVVLSGAALAIWPRLREFWLENGYSLSLDDPELGVMETGWQETGSDGVTVGRSKFILFTEAGSQADTTRVYLSSESQERLASSGEDGTWLDVPSDTGIERDLADQLNRYFGGGSLAATSAGGRNQPAPRATVRELGNDRVLLEMPDDYSTAWQITGRALRQPGFLIKSEDETNGLYNILFFPSEEEEGFFSKLKFWGDDQSDGVPYQLSMAPSGERAELTVLDEDGGQVDRDEASRVLLLLQGYYNGQRR
jgi:outer membrane protein assembly factor BamC